MFTPGKMLQNHINAQPRDMFDIIGALMGYINADPQFKTSEFDQAVQYVLAHGVTEKELFAEFDDNIELEEDAAKWDEEYYSFARVYLKDNFCKKRIEHVKAVAGKLYPKVAVPKTAPQQERRPSQAAPQTGGTQSTGKKTQSQQFKTSKNSLTSTTLIIMLLIIVLLAVVVVRMLTK